MTMKKLMCILIFSVLLTFTACANPDDTLRSTAKEYITSYINNTKSTESIVTSEVIIEEITPTDSDIWLITGTASITTTENSSPTSFGFHFTAEKSTENEYIFTDTEIYYIN